MTCIVGIKEDGKLWIGGDSAAINLTTSEIYTIASRKVFRAGSYLVGYTISFRAGQVLEHEVEWPEPPEGAEIGSFLVRELVPRLREALREAGALKTTEGVDQGAHFMIGIGGEFYSVALDFSVTPLAESFMAIGAGRHNAYGALHALAGLGMPPQERMRRALEAAARYTCGVREPFYFLSPPACSAVEQVDRRRSCPAAVSDG